MRWPVVVVVVIVLAAISCGLISLRSPADKNTKDTLGVTDIPNKQVPTKPRAISSVALRNNRPDSTNSAADSKTKQAVTDLTSKMVALAANTGMNEEVEKSIHEVASLGDNAVSELGRLVRPDQNINVREAAARGMAEIGSPQAITTLLEAVLSESNDEQRRILISALHALANPTAANELVAALLKTQDPIVLPTVRDTLARVAGTPATGIIALAYHEDAAEGWQQSNLMGTLLRVRSPEAVSGLNDILTSDTSFSLRSQAAISLGLIGNKEAIESLLVAIEQPQTFAFKEMLVDSLGAVRNKNSLNSLVSLINQSTNESIRYAAAMALGNIPNDASVNALRSALERETSGAVRRTLQASLGKIESDRKSNR